MDGLSGAASGVAVVSLTFQIVEGISKLRDFFDSMKKAPKFVAIIVNDLAHLSSILDGINVDEQKYNDVLTTCMDKIKDLNAIPDELEPGFQSTSQRVRQWTVFRAVRKDAAIKRFRDMLEEMKSMLILALQSKNFSLR
jgi:hypothetical protein